LTFAEIYGYYDILQLLWKRRWRMPEKRRASKARRSREPRRGSRRWREDEEEIVEPEPTKWLGMPPWATILLGIGIIIILFAPIFSTTKTVNVKETVFESVTEQQPMTTQGQETVRVWVGWMRTIQGAQHIIDVDDQIVDIQIQPRAGGREDIVLTNIDGRQVKTVRGVNSRELNKTGEITVASEKTAYETVTKQVPREVTRQDTIKVPASLIQLIFGTAG
jgi:hypothetical protein